MKIIVIGESCKDVFVYGDCNRLSPEAPVPVMIPKVIKDNLGMSGNVVKNLEALDSNIDDSLISLLNCVQFEKELKIGSKSEILELSGILTFILLVIICYFIFLRYIIYSIFFHKSIFHST